MKALERLKELCARDGHGGLIYIGDFYSVAAHAVPALIELVEAQGELIDSLKCGGFFRDDSPAIDRMDKARAKLESLEV